MFKKTIILFVFSLFVFSNTTKAQISDLFFVEFNQNLFSNAKSVSSSTNIGFVLNDRRFSYSLGLSGGYFMVDNLALKIGVSYTRNSDTADKKIYSLNGSAGLDYYINNVVPIGVDYHFNKIQGDKQLNSFIGAQIGYFWHIFDGIGFKPFIRYDFALNRINKDYLTFGVGITYIIL